METKSLRSTDLDLSFIDTMQESPLTDIWRLCQLLPKSRGHCQEALVSRKFLLILSSKESPHSTPFISHGSVLRSHTEQMYSSFLIQPLTHLEAAVILFLLHQLPFLYDSHHLFEELLTSHELQLSPTATTTFSCTDPQSDAQSEFPVLIHRAIMSKGTQANTAEGFESQR